MLEGLFIFCLLIRAARRGEGERGEGEIQEECRQTDGGGGEEEGENTLFQQTRRLLLIIQQAVRVLPFDLPEFMRAA